jgi:hypothetical protein
MQTAIPETRMGRKRVKSPLLSRLHPALRVESRARLFLSEEHGLLYWRIPKAANSTVVLTLARHIGGYELADDPSGSRIKEEFIRFDAIETMPVPDILGRFTCFTVVRNPYDRALSAFLTKARNPRHIERFHSGNKLFSKELTFHDFLLALNDGLLLRDPHWAPQTELLPLKADEFHDIARVETLDHDLRRILEPLFGRYLGMWQKERSRSHAASLRDEYYGRSEERLLERLYAADFEAFYPDLAWR